MRTRFINEQTMMIYFENEISESIFERVQQTIQYIKSKNLFEITNVIPSYRAILIYSGNSGINGTELLENLELDESSNSRKQPHFKQRITHIPVLYDGDFSPDLSEVANVNKLSQEEVIQIHTQQPYLIYMLGSMPGFPYLSGLDTKLYTPRRSEPRVKINADSAGMTNNQTGLYSVDPPGGWQMVGRAPIKIFDLNRTPMTLYEAGDYIQSYSINYQEFEKMSDDINKGKFDIDKWVTYQDEY